MTTDLDVVALAARTPVGLTAESSAAAVRAGIARLREYAFVDPSGEPIIVASDPVLADDVQVRERLGALAEHVLDEIANEEIDVQRARHVDSDGEKGVTHG